MGYRYVHVYNIAESLSGVYCLHILVVSQRSSRDAWEDDEKTKESHVAIETGVLLSLSPQVRLGMLMMLLSLGHS